MSNSKTTPVGLNPGRIYKSDNEARYLAGICFDGNSATVTWAHPVTGSPWQQCDAYEFRTWMLDSGAKVLDDRP